MLYSKNIPISYKCDVLVCGGGPGGFAAAVNAAKQGVSTILVEKLGFLGGMATAGLVNPMIDFANDDGWVISGFPRTFADRMIQEGGGICEKPRCNLSFNPEVYKLVAQKMVLESGANLLTNTLLVDCIVKDRIIDCCIFTNRNGLFAIKAKYYIDGTGDALLANMAGVPMLENTMAIQPGSLCFCLAGVDTSTERMHIIHQKNNHFNHQATFIRDALERLRAEGREIPQYGGPWLATTLNPGEITVNFTRRAMDCTKQEEYSTAEQKMLQDVFTLTGMLKERVPEFRNCYISSIATVAGTRQGRRISGCYVLSGKDYLEGTKFKDSISRACHPIDIHLPDGNGQKLIFPEKAAYVPYRSLISPGFGNIIMAGRAISADEEAFGAIRVQAPSMEIGQGAGIAAALCVKSGNCLVTELDTEKLVDEVRKCGTLV